MSGGAETWRITSEDRQKHDAQFFSLKPSMGFVNGDQARGFFLQSGLPGPVLGQIWSLADLNADGKMDRKEFSIAMFLVKKKLQGFEIPKVLPTSLKSDPSPSFGNFGAMQTSPIHQSSSVPSFGGSGFGSASLKAPASQPMAGGMQNGIMRAGTMPAGGGPGFTDPRQRAGSQGDRERSGSAGGDWAIPHQNKLRYNQMFNANDRFRRNHLTGVEARGILQQTGLPQPVLAQIWSLSDIDMDGKLTQEEFCLAMHLADTAKLGQILPSRLPPELIPPSFKRGRSHSNVSVGAPSPLDMQQQVPLPIQPQQPVMVSTGGASNLNIGMPLLDQNSPLDAAMFVTFEDKRKENFDKGQAELEKRRQMLRDMQRQEEDSRLAKERAEQEKREKIRLEQERKKQQEMEKHMQRQREIEREKEEQRRKAMEAREAARREMERQRHLEWERQRKEQLMAEKRREQEVLASLKSQVNNIKYELEALDNKKSEILLKIQQSKINVSSHTTEIDKMRENRDSKLSEMESLQRHASDAKQKLTFLMKDKEKYNLNLQTTLQGNPLSDMYKTIQHSYHSKKLMIDRLRNNLETVENDTAVKLQEIDTNNGDLKVMRVKFATLDSENRELEMQLKRKQQEWAEFKRKQDQEKQDQLKSQRDKQDRVRRELEQQRIREENERKREEEEEERWQREEAVRKQKEEEERKRREEQDRLAEEKRKQEEENKKKKEEDMFAGFDLKPAASQNGTTDVWGSAFETSDQQTTNSNDVWGDAFGSQAPAKNDTWATGFGSSETPAATTNHATSKNTDGFNYKAQFQFDARNHDELTLIPGDTIFVSTDQTGCEPGWMKGSKDGKEGFFPEAYVEKLPDDQQPASLNESPKESQVEASVTNTLNSQPSNDFKPAFELNTSIDSSFLPVKSSTPQVPSASPTPGQGESAPEGLQAQALYPWRAKKDNHLSFNKGDIINVKEQQDIWWSGELNDKIGWFPKSYVKPVSSPSQRSSSEIPTVSVLPSTDLQTDSTRSSPAVDEDEPQGEYFVAMYKYFSAEHGDLSFNQGDIITVTKQDSDWWTGTLGDATGIFPANYVKKMETQETGEDEGDGIGAIEFTPTPRSPPPSVLSAAPTLTPSKPGQKLGAKKPEIASVIAPYEATGAEQLSLQPGQLIQVRKKSPSGWWEGELQARGQKKKIGWFPANYVKLLGGGDRSTPSELSKSPTPQPSTTPTVEAAAEPPMASLAVDTVISLYPYTAQNPDELSFQKNSAINVLSKEDPDWWKGELNGETGVFPANYVQPLSDVRPETPAMNEWQSDPAVLAVTSAMEVKRQQHLHEMINTEESYMADMSIVLDVFYRPLSASKVLSEQELKSIFVNWKELIICNTKLLKAMRVRKKMSGDGQVIHIVGDILCENLPHLTPYIRFCSCQLNAAALIQHMFESSAQFKEVCQKCCQDTRTKGMPLSSFLLKPMQRITKYPLLIEKILEYTPPTHPDHQNLQDAKEAASLLCSQVNEGVREKENSDRLEWIQNHVQCEGLAEKITFNSVTNSMGPRKFLFSGTVYKAKSNKELVAFLFNDFFLLGQPMRALGSVVQVFNFDPTGTTQYRMYRQPLFLNEVVVKMPTDPEAEPLVFHIHHIDKIFSLKAVTANERDNWFKKLDQACKDYLDNERKKRERAYSMSKKSRGIGRLLVIVVEAKHLIPSDANVRKSPGVGRLLVVLLEGCNLNPSDATGKSDPYCEVSMGTQEHKTKVINSTLNPKWNSSMQFTIKDVNQDVLCITVFDRDLFTPNDFLGRTEIRIADILSESKDKKGPITKRLQLLEVETGEVVVKLDLQLYQTN